jgi:hypothetical protein
MFTPYINPFEEEDELNSYLDYLELEDYPEDDN